MKYLLTILATLVSLAFSAASEAVTIKLATLAPKGSPWHVALQEMAASWSELSNGEVELRIYPGGVAGSEPDMIRKIRIGQLQGAALSGQDGLSQIAPELRVFETPMLIRSNAELDHIRRCVRGQLEDLLADKGFQVLGWSDVGWVYLFTTKKVVYPDDARPLRIRVGPGDATWATFLRDHGYHPVPLPGTEIHTGLASGLIDGFSTPPVMALSTQWFGVANHMAAMEWAPLTGAVVLSRDAWQRIPAAMRPQLQAAANKAALDAQAQIRSFESEAIEAMKKYGLQVHEVPEDARAEWEREVADAYGAMVQSSVPQGIFDTVKGIRDHYRAEGEANVESCMGD